MKGWGGSFRGWGGGRVNYRSLARELFTNEHCILFQLYCNSTSIIPL